MSWIEPPGVTRPPPECGAKGYGDYREFCDRLRIPYLKETWHGEAYSLGKRIEIGEMVSCHRNFAALGRGRNAFGPPASESRSGAGGHPLSRRAATRRDQHRAWRNATPCPPDCRELAGTRCSGLGDIARATVVGLSGDPCGAMDVRVVSRPERAVMAGTLHEVPQPTAGQTAFRHPRA